MSPKPGTVSLHYNWSRIVVGKYRAYDSRATQSRRGAASRPVGEHSDPNSVVEIGVFGVESQETINSDEITLF